MECTVVQAHLSAFVDGELPSDTSVEVAGHLAQCAACQRMRSSYSRLGELTRVEPVTPPSAELWSGIATALSNQAEPSRPELAIPWRWSSFGRMWAAAIAIVLLVGIGLVAWRSQPLTKAERQLADVFDRYLAEFAKSPVEAQQILDKAYPSTLVSWDQPHPLADESVLARRGMPPGLKLVSVVVRNLPCCDCVQGLYQRNDGSYLTVFEHEMPTTWDANQRCTEVNCGECKCRLMRFDSKVAASWKHDSRYFTVIGAHDVAELEQLVTTLDPAPQPDVSPDSPLGDS